MDAKKLEQGNLIDISRRSFIKQAAAGAALFATASVGPWFVKNALSSSGELLLFTWPDYSKPEVISAFEKDTGIKVKVINYSTNQECMNKLRAARATGFDIAQPSLTEFELHMEYDLYQEMDENKISNLGDSTHFEPGSNVNICFGVDNTLLLFMGDSIDG